KKRILPCLDIDRGRVVKGINFLNIQDTGDPVALAAYYASHGADELVFLDITASHEERSITLDVVRAVAKEVFIPFAVGGGIRTLDDMFSLLDAGADKATINSAAIANPQLIDEASKTFGSQCVVVAIDAKREDNDWTVYTHGGRRRTALKAEEWAGEVHDRGAGEILLTSMDRDGTKIGYDLELTQTICQSVNIPVIASGGVGALQHFVDVFEKTDADAALAASVFHFGSFSIEGVKTFLKHNGIPVRRAGK
ncbi:MAG: imidazole glycerol phosphate synthase subunit HisF, partial [Waddliaceae bacterium]